MRNTFLKKNVKNLRIHVITDGRDTSVTSGLGFIEDLEKVMSFAEGYKDFISKVCLKKQFENKRKNSF